MPLVKYGALPGSLWPTTSLLLVGRSSTSAPPRTPKSSSRAPPHPNPPHHHHQFFFFPVQVPFGEDPGDPSIGGNEPGQDTGPAGEKMKLWIRAAAPGAGGENVPRRRFESSSLRCVCVQCFCFLFLVFFFSPTGCRCSAGEKKTNEETARQETTRPN